MADTYSERVIEQAQGYLRWPETFDIDHPAYWIKMVYMTRNIGEWVHPLPPIYTERTLAATTVALALLTLDSEASRWTLGIDYLVDVVAEMSAAEGAHLSNYPKSWVSVCQTYIDGLCGRKPPRCTRPAL